MNSYFLRMNINILPRKYNCSLFDRFCTILADISLIMTSDYFGLILIDRDRSKSFIGQYQKQSKTSQTQYIYIE